jgi:hypothetical protein
MPLYRKYPTRTYANDSKLKLNIKNPAIVITSETIWRAERFFALAVNISIFIK